MTNPQYKVAQAINLVIAGSLADYVNGIDIQDVPILLQEMATDYEKEYKRQLKENQ